MHLDDLGVSLPRQVIEVYCEQISIPSLIQESLDPLRMALYERFKMCCAVEIDVS